MAKEKKEKIRRGDRRDGIWLRNEPAMNQFMAYLYPNRAENEAYINEELDLRPIEEYLARKNAGRTEDKYTYFHIICAAVVKAFVLRPKMNRFISGNRMYQRKYLSVAFVVKKKFSDRAEEGLAFRKFDESSTIDKLHDSLIDEIHTQRKEGAVDNSTYFMEKLLKLPRWVLRLVMKLLFSLDRKGKVPYDLVKDDPNYSSIFLTNLGSIDLNCGYHHLCNWGTCSCFVVIGKKHLVPSGRQRIHPARAEHRRYPGRADCRRLLLRQDHEAGQAPAGPSGAAGAPGGGSGGLSAQGRQAVCGRELRVEK